MNGMLSLGQAFGPSHGDESPPLVIPSVKWAFGPLMDESLHPVIPSGARNLLLLFFTAKSRFFFGRRATSSE